MHTVHQKTYKPGYIAIRLVSSLQHTHAAALTMDEEPYTGLEASMAKLLASDVAVWLTHEGQLLHGGWGYAEETPISRYVVDSQVLPIFEGAKPVLELRVIGAALLRGG